MIMDNYLSNKGEPMKQKQNISIKQIAKLSGVSVATVSRVIITMVAFQKKREKEL